MPRGPKIAPLRVDEREYERVLAEEILRPLLAEWNGVIDRAGASYEAIRQAILALPEDPRLAGLSERAARRELTRIKNKHTRRFERVMRRYLGVRVDLLTDEPIDLEARIADNVALIKTIPPRAHTALAGDLERLAVEAPFDQNRLHNTLRSQYGSAGYNVRRLTRDQTNKLIGDLNQARQTEVGIERYEWLTSQDERVRPRHVRNSGLIFSWDNPPPDTGHPGEDIQCRCVAVPILPGIVPRAREPRPDAPPGPHSILAEPPAPPPPAPSAAPPTPAPPRPFEATPADYRRLPRPGDDGWAGIDDRTSGPFSGVGRTMSRADFEDRMNETWRANPLTEAGTEMRFTGPDLDEGAMAEIAEAWAWLSERYPLAAQRVPRVASDSIDPGTGRAIAHTGYASNPAVEAGQVAGRLIGSDDTLGVAMDWARAHTRHVTDSFVGFNRRFYGELPEALAPGPRAWKVGDQMRAYGRQTMDGEGQQRVRTTVHEFGHQVGYQTFARWGVEAALEYNEKTRRYDEALQRYWDGTRKTRPSRPRLPKPVFDRPTRGYSRNAPSKAGSGSPVAEQRFAEMVKRHSDELGAPRAPIIKRWRPDGTPEYHPWSYAEDVSVYASWNIHEFTAEAFTAVAMYGDDAPLIARLWMREINDAIEAMTDETLAARRAMP